jgi:hypothetical protein
MISASACRSSQPDMAVQPAQEFHTPTPCLGTGSVLVEGTCVLSVTSWAYGMCSKARRIEATLRFNVQLTSGETGAHLWSDRFDEEISELAAGQEHIVTRMRSELGISMVEIEKARSLRERPTNPDAFDLILWARALENQLPNIQRTTQQGHFTSRRWSETVRRHSLWLESLFIWWIEARRADTGQSRHHASC